MKRFSQILFVSLLVALLLAGQSQYVQAQTDTFQKVLSSGVIRVGILPDFPPWSFRDERGNFVGYDVDLAMLLGEALGAKVELVPVEAPNRVPALVSDKVDVLIACLTPTDERARTINFTIPYASAGLVPMVRANNNEIQSWRDLPGKTVVLVRGGTPDLYTSKLIPEANIVRFDTIADAYTAFMTGRGDAFIEEDTFVYSEVKKDPRFRAAGEPFTRELLSFGVKKNDQEWLNYLNNFLTNIRFNDTNTELYEKWFGTKPAPLNVD